MCISFFVLLTVIHEKVITGDPGWGRGFNGYSSRYRVAQWPQTNVRNLRTTRKILQRKGCKFDSSTDWFIIADNCLITTNTRQHGILPSPAASDLTDFSASTEAFTRFCIYSQLTILQWDIRAISGLSKAIIKRGGGGRYLNGGYLRGGRKGFPCHSSYAPPAHTPIPSLSGALRNCILRENIATIIINDLFYTNP